MLNISDLHRPNFAYLPPTEALNENMRNLNTFVNPLIINGLYIIAFFRHCN
jgi:hypothetical protein